MSALTSLDWDAVRRHYDERVVAHREALSLHDNGCVPEFCDLILGVSDPTGNYSAAEHGLGPKVLSTNYNAEQRVFEIAGQFRLLLHAHSVPSVIRHANLQYLRIGVGSEISCLMNPEHCWVANVRTIWTHLVIKHADSFDKANEELQLYREADVGSEMHYQMWAAIHAELATSMTRIAEEGSRLALKARVPPGPVTFLWADAIANALYEQN
jgi:hypothetical protein